MKKLTILVFTIFTFLLFTPASNEVVAADYYASININDSLDDFSNDLTSLLTSTHNYKSYGSGYNAILAEGAAISPGSSSLELFYTGHIDTLSNAGGGNVNEWNKEHVWPKSQTGGENSAPANDIHNIRPTNTKINSTRSNLPFGEDFGGSIAYAAVDYADGSTYCYYGNGYFEPRDEVKGDCARIIFYILTRYESLNLNVNTVGDMNMLLRWHYADPVSEYELNMNDAIEDYQGNRNPYIDHPEYVDKMYPNEYGMSFEELNDITVPTEVTSDITLATKAGEYDITWSSDNAALSNTGVVTQDVKDITVKLTASITKEGMTGTKEFTVIVKARALTITESFEYSQMKNSLAIDYVDYSELEEVTVKTGAIDNTGASGNFLNLTTGSNYAGNFGLDEDELYLQLENQGTSNGVSYYKTETLTLNTGSSVKLSSLSGAIKSVKVTYSSSYEGAYLSTTATGGTELQNNTAVNIDANDVYIISPTGQARITAIEIVYVTGVSNYDISNINFNFGFEITQSAYNELSKASDFEMGLLYINEEDLTGNISDKYTSGSISSFISSNNLSKKELEKYTSNNNYLFSVNLESNTNQSIKSCAYMVYNGQVYFTENVNRSISDVANIYINEYSQDPLVSNYVDLLRYIIKN
ncbi:MAG: endonuclease [bacterium]